jgi:hypothetical protein
MTATIPAAALVAARPVFTESARPALAGFLAGYRGLTREAQTLDLRQFTTVCRIWPLPLFSVRGADIEAFARDPGMGHPEMVRWLAQPSGTDCGTIPGMSWRVPYS